MTENNLKNLFLIGVSVVFCAILYTIAFSTPNIPIKAESNFVGKVKFDSTSIRLLILKHSYEQMADGDAKLAIEAVSVASTKGLSIKQIGEHNINRQGQADRRLVFYSSDKLKDYVNDQMKISAEENDTLIIFTIGHGSRSGYLASLGQRQDIQKVFSECAVENSQKTIWWQLSCFASADLNYNGLSSEKKDFFSVIASSDSFTESPAYVEGKIMEKVFVALATGDVRVDPDKDGIILAKELANFLNVVSQGRGNLVYAKNADQVMFGIAGIARNFPIIDQDGILREYPKDYIPFPKNPILIPR